MDHVLNARWRREDDDFDMSIRKGTLVQQMVGTDSACESTACL